MKIRFDENDDVVLDDIPDDLIRAIEQRASVNGQSAEEEVRAILIELYRHDPCGPARESPLP